MQQHTSKPKRKQPVSQQLLVRLDKLTQAIEEQTRAIKALVRENTKLVDVLLADADVIDDDAQPHVYLDGTRAS